MWTLSDLTDCDRIVSFYLFGQTHQALWKTSEGSVIGILNAQIMANSEKVGRNHSLQYSGIIIFVRYY